MVLLGNSLFKGTCQRGQRCNQLVGLCQAQVVDGLGHDGVEPLSGVLEDGFAFLGQADAAAAASA